jgi:subtilisin-like proprotein convertase family protein
MKTLKLFRLYSNLLLLLFYGFSPAIFAQVTIGSGTSTQRYPLGAYWGYERSASLYTSAEILTSGSITNLAWYPTESSSVSRPIKIYLKTTSSTSLSAVKWATMISGATLVYNGSTGSIPSNTWFSFLLSASFDYNGSDNLLVLVETNYGGSGGTTSTNPYCRYSSATNRHQIWTNDYSAPTGNGSVGSSRPNIQITFSVSCATPAFISGTNITGSTADISWITATPAPDNGYQYYLSTSATEPDYETVPTGATAAGVVSVQLSGLSASTQYYLWVRSDCGSSDYSEWEGSYSFSTTNPPCDVSSISFSTSDPQPVLSGGIYYFDVCNDSDIFLSASVVCSSCTSPDYSWTINAYNGNGPQEYSNDEFYFTISQNSGYDAQLKYEATGCVNTWPLRFRSSSGPNILNVSATIDGCAGNSAQILIGEGNTDIEIEPFTGETSASLGSGEETFIPDGPSCVEQCYESEVIFTDFPIGSEISSADDILYLRINFEHSFVGDIQISLVGPGNCGSAIILPDYFTIAQGGIDNYTYSWPYMDGSSYERIGFGDAVTLDIASYADECNGELAENVAGTGWDYCWSNNSSYSYANGSGYVYESVNMSSNVVLPYYRVNPSDPVEKTNFYRPFQSFSNLVGCPLNGTWTVSVCDSWAIDNGWIFDWEIALDPDLLPNGWSYQTSIDHVDFNLGTNATANYLSGTNPMIYELVPVAGLITGSYSGTFTVYDDYGCPTSADIYYSVQGLPTISDIHEGDYVWSGYANEFWNCSEENNWIVKTASGYDVSSIAPPTGSNIYIIDFCNSSEMPELQQDISVHDISIISGGLSLSNHVLTVTGDFRNDDVFDAATGTIVLSGSTLQNVDAGGESFYNLTVSNTGTGISQLDNINVENSLTMNSGNITTGSYLLTLGIDAINTGSLTHNSGTVNGSFKRWFNAATVSSVLFPVGTLDYYRPAYISFSSSPSTGGTLTASFVTADPGTLPLALDDVGYLIDAVADEGYWTISNSGITDGVYNLDIAASGFVVADYTKLHLLKREDEFSDWMLDGTHVASDGNAASPVLHRDGLTGFSDFGVGIRSGTLPVELVYFKSECEQNSVFLTWNTASETNSSHFVLEKSFDLKTFFEIVTIPAAGNSNTESSYFYEDNQIAQSVAYYRLRQIDICGFSKISKTIYSNCMYEIESPLLFLYPNPVSDVLFVRIENSDIVNHRVEIVNDCGKIVFADNTCAYLNYSINVATLSPGVYTLRFISDSNVLTSKLVKR